MSDDPINQSAELLLKEKKIEVATKQNTEIEQVIDTIDNDLGFFANSILRITVGKAKLREILSKKKITSKDDFLDAAFNEKATLFGSEQLGSAANWIGKKTLEFSNYFSDVFKILTAKNKEILAIVDKYKLELDNLKNEVEKDNEHKNESEDKSEDENKDNEHKNESEDKSEDENKDTDNTKPSTFGTSVLAYGAMGAATFATTKTAKALNTISINRKLKQLDLLDVNKQENVIGDLIEEFKLRQQWKGFDTPAGLKAKKNIQKTIDHFEQMKKDLRVSRSSLLAWKKLEKAGLLDKEAFAFFAGQKGSLDNLKQIIKAKKLDELKELLTTNPKKAKQLLGIAKDVDMPEGLIKSIKNITKVKDVTKIGEVLKDAKVLSRTAKFMRSIPLLDLASFGLDIWIRDNAKDEAARVSKYNQMRGQILRHQAHTHFGINIVSGVLEASLSAITMGLGASGPPGWVVLAIGTAIGGTTAAVIHGVDSMYYDVLSFYHKTTADYIRQYRIENKQAIVSIMQSLNPNIENSINESLFINEDNVNTKEKIQTMLDAYQGLILNEEGLSVNDKDNTIVKTRMQYIKSNMTDKKMIIACANGDVNAPARLLAESKIYEQMLQDQAYMTKNNKPKANLQSLINYKAWLSLTLETEKPESYHYLMQMSDDEFFWIHHIVANRDLSVDNHDTREYQNATLIHKVFTIRSFGKSSEELTQFHNRISSSTYFSLNTFLSQDSIKEGFKPSVKYNKEELTQNYIEGNTDYYEKTILSDVSADPAQNILYRIAKEIHGYNGANTKESLLNHFSRVDKDDALGIYYDGKRIVNNDRAIDKSFDPAIFTNPKLSTKDIIKTLVQPHWVSHLLPNIFGSGTEGATIDAIDTATETADESLNLNFWSQIAHILEQERAYLMPKKKAQIQTNIKKYIKENASDGYISLPYYLQVQALKSGLGNCENSFFRYENGKIIEIAPQRPYSATLNFPHIKKPFVDKTESIARPYDTLDNSAKKALDQEIKKFTDQVDKPLARLQTILADGGLDIPKAYQQIIDNKISKRQRLKFSLRGYETREIKSKLKNNYVTYAKRFDSLYLSLLSGVYSNLLFADQDSALTMQQHLALAEHDIIQINAKNNNVTLYFQGRIYGEKPDKDASIETASNDLTKMFFSLYNTVKFPYKGKNISCEEMTKNNEQDAAKHYAHLIRRSLLELETVNFDESKKGDLKFDSFNTNLEKGIEKHWNKVLIASPLIIPATLFSRYKSNSEKEQKQALFKKILAYNLKNNPYKIPEFSDGF